MSEFTENIEDVEENSNDQAARINAKIQQLVDLKEKIKRREETLEQYDSVHAMLTMSVRSWQIKYKELRKREADLRATMSGFMQLSDKKEEELRNLNKERIAFLSEQREKFRAMCNMYADKFLGAYKEYSTENLTKEIQEINEKYEKMQVEVSVLGEELNNLKSQCGFKDLMPNKEDDEIAKIDAILADVTEENNHQLLGILTAENTAKKLRNEIKRKTKILKAMKRK